jgi:hypothetical protein
LTVSGSSSNSYSRDIHLSKIHLSPKNALASKMPKIQQSEQRSMKTNKLHYHAFSILKKTKEKKSRKHTYTHTLPRATPERNSYLRQSENPEKLNQSFSKSFSIRLTGWSSIPGIHILFSCNFPSNPTPPSVFSASPQFCFTMGQLSHLRYKLRGKRLA